ncbi:MAG: hypothetical protein J0H31_07225, partial [Alphaproteobacteria bacterium]|nr:hypothetical protein [Alphaproteobacteria bacterium]
SLVFMHVVFPKPRSFLGDMHAGDKSSWKHCGSHSGLISGRSSAIAAHKSQLPRNFRREAACAPFLELPQKAEVPA